MKDMESTEMLLTVDKDRLDEEWVRQPKLFYQYASNLAEAKGDVAEAKAELEVVKAELAHEIRMDPGNYGIKKVTNDTIDAAVILEDRYQKALRYYNKAVRQVDMLDAAVKALEHKKKSLESLVYLHGQNYFSTPMVKGEDNRNVTEEYEKKQARKKVARALEED